jgi:cupin superfamily acireductone dioxygenase involved in methionine salvage
LLLHSEAMKMNLILNGLDPVKELARHDALAAQYRDEMKSMGRRRNWKWCDLLRSVTYHEESAATLRKEGVAFGSRPTGTVQTV